MGLESRLWMNVRNALTLNGCFFVQNSIASALLESLNRYMPDKIFSLKMQHLNTDDLLQWEHWKNVYCVSCGDINALLMGH